MKDEASPQVLDPLLHSQKPHGGRGSFRVKAPAVVLYLAKEPVFFPPEAHGYPLGLGVAQDVGQGLLHHPEKGDFLLLGKGGRSS